MNIIPISGMQVPTFINKPTGMIELGGKAAGSVGGLTPMDSSSQPSSFKDIFTDAVNSVESLDSVTKQDAYNLSLGQVDDIGQVLVNAQKKEVSVQMLVQMRDKLLNAYNEIMRMNV